MRHGWALGWILFVGCGSPETFTETPVEDPLRADWRRIIAYLDGEPIRYVDLLETAAETDLQTLLRRHLLKRVIERERESLGVTASDDELLARARAAVRHFKASRGTAELLRRIEQSGAKSEEEYVRRLAPTLRERLLNEKVVVRGLRKRGWVRADIEAYDRPGAKEPRTRLERLVFARGMIRPDLGKELENIVFAAKPGETIGPTRAPGGRWLRIRVIDRGDPEPEPDPEEVFRSILLDPPSDRTLQLYFEWRLRESKVWIPEPRR